MNARQTQTVQSAYVGRDGKPRCFVRGGILPLYTETLLNEGDAVIVRGQTAERPNTINQG